MGLVLSSCLSHHYYHQYQEINQKTIQDAIYDHDYEYLEKHAQDETYDWITFILTKEVGDKIVLIRIFDYLITKEHLGLTDDPLVKDELEKVLFSPKLFNFS